MSPETFTREDLALFLALDRAARAIGVTPYMIGAGAIQLGPARHWESRPRMTRDWDFAVRVNTWNEFHSLKKQLTEAGFTCAAEEHRLKHTSGRILDIVPFGGLASPNGEIRWRDGTEMNTSALHVLENSHECRQIEDVELRIATLPALVALKMLAYVARRPGITRDIADAHRMLFEVESTFNDERIDEAAWARLEAGEPTYNELGPYFVGRDVRVILSEEESSTVEELCVEAAREESAVVPDIMRSTDALANSRDDVLRRMGAFRIGMSESIQREASPWPRQARSE